MNKQYLMIISFLFLVSGCATTKTFTPAAGLDKENISSRSIPAKISKESKENLGKKGYLAIGSVWSEDIINSCWGDDCDNFACTANLSHKDTTKEVLENAASRGGDLVVLDKDSVLSIDATTKQGKCLGGYYTDYTELQCSAPYGNVKGYCQNVTKKQFHCTSTLTVFGKICKFESSGSAWRYDPEMAKRLAIYTKAREKELAVIAKEQEEAKKSIQRENDKKEKTAKKRELQIAALKKAYEETYPPQSITFIKESGKRRTQIAALKKAYEENYPFQKGELEDVKIDGKYGFKDKNGKMIITPQFSDTMGFSDGVAVVSVGNKNDKKWGIIDKTGQWITPPSDKYKSIGKFSDGMVTVEIDNKCGYFNTNGRLVIPPQFTICWWFSEGLAMVWVDKKHKYIDKTGKVIIQPEVHMAYQFSDGLAAVEVDRLFGYIDKKGNYIIKPQFDDAKRFVNGIARVTVDGEQMYIDKSGKIIPKQMYMDQR